MVTRLTRRSVLGATLAAPLARPAIAQGATIELWSFLDPAGRGVRSEAMAHVIKTYEEANAGVRVRTNVIRWTEIGPQLLRAAHAGQVPDVVMLYSPYMAPQVGANTLLPLDEFMQGWSADNRADLITMPIARDRQNRLYGLPWEMRVFGLFWRVDLFQGAGITPPTTLDAMVTAGKRLQQGSVQGLGVSFNSATSTAAIEWFLPSVVALGGSLLREDGAASFAGPATERMLQFCHDLVHKHRILTLDSALMVSDDLQNVGIAGNIAQYFQGSHRLSTMQERAPQGARFSLVPFPAVEEGKPTPVSLQGWHLSIPRRARNVQPAWRFIEHWASAPIQVHQAAAAGYLPVRRSVARDPAFATEQNRAFGLTEILEAVAQRPLNFNWPENSDALNDALGRMIQQVITERMAIRDAMAWGDRTYNELRR
jgi:ABC-type glycerol-3-phosphate transport system substrate-binding protein